MAISKMLTIIRIDLTTVVTDKSTVYCKNLGWIYQSFSEKSSHLITEVGSFSV